MKTETEFLANVKKHVTGCWEWCAGKDRGGYGKLYWRGRMRSAHSVAYEIYVGSVRSGLDLDHLCRNRRCCNPAHLEPVTRRENCARGLTGVKPTPTACRRGHAYTETTLRIYYCGSQRTRYCVTCGDMNRAARRAK